MCDGWMGIMTSSNLDIMDTRSVGLEILSTDENFKRMSSMIRCGDISLMEYQQLARVV